MSGDQMLLDLAGDQAMQRSDFLVSESNSAGLAAIDAWRAWPEGRMLLCGPRGSGRTHLLRIWTGETGARLLDGRSMTTADLIATQGAPGVAVDDAELAAGQEEGEEVLFHLFNVCASEGKPLLLSARDTPGTWGLRLPDLESRALTCAVTGLARPDDILLRMVLVKLCDDRQLAIGEDTLRFLAARIDRSLDAARRVVGALDHAAVARQKRVSRALAADVLAQFDQSSP